ncbi:MAG: hypothetical protein R3F11_02770 [Verrucomicrobiales bacterium]
MTVRPAGGVATQAAGLPELPWVKGDSPRLPCYYYELIRLPYKWLNCQR